MTRHGISDGEGDSGRPPAEEGFIGFGETHEGVGGPFGASENGPAIIMPIDDEVSVAEEAD